MLNNQSDTEDNLKIASKLINEFLSMDPAEKAKLDHNFIRSIIEPFLGKREQFTRILREETSLV